MTTIGPSISRRRALGGAATAGLGLSLLAACGDDDAGPAATDDTTASSPSGSSERPTTPERTTSEPAPSAPVGDGIPTAEVPVGGGIVVTEEQTVVTQPVEGEFRAFTAVCTHAQCLVTTVSDGTINCPCHGSRFSIDDGSVAGGPAPAALGAVDVTVDGDRIVLG